MDAFVNKRNDEQMARAFQAGDEKALAFFYERLLPVLAMSAFRYIKNAAVAEEIASEALVNTWRMRSKLDSVGAIKAYAYSCVRNACSRAAEIRKKRLHAEQQAGGFDSDTDTPYQFTIRAEVYRLVHTALKELPEGSRTVLTMHFIEGKSTGEIARELNRATSTIKTQKANGLAALRKKMQWPAFILFSIFLETFWFFA
jgi:RNA polymerase sigma factor (sigma-70 family)